MLIGALSWQGWICRGISWLNGSLPLRVLIRVKLGHSQHDEEINIQSYHYWFWSAPLCSVNQKWIKKLASTYNFVQKQMSQSLPVVQTLVCLEPRTDPYLPWSSDIYRGPGSGREGAFFAACAGLHWGEVFRRMLTTANADGVQERCCDYLFR